MLFVAGATLHRLVCMEIIQDQQQRTATNGSLQLAKHQATLLIVVFIILVILVKGILVTSAAGARKRKSVCKSVRRKNVTTLRIIKHVKRHALTFLQTAVTV